MTLEEFIRDNDVDQGPRHIAESDIPIMETAMGADMGPQLRRYVLRYVYLGFRHVELYGINAIQGTASDMVHMTQLLHKDCPQTKGLIALENQGDGVFIMADSQDMVWRVLTPRGGPEPLGQKLFDYILTRFESIKE